MASLDKYMVVRWHDVAPLNTVLFRQKRGHHGAKMTSATAILQGCMLPMESTHFHPITSRLCEEICSGYLTLEHFFLHAIIRHFLWGETHTLTL